MERLHDELSIGRPLNSEDYNSIVPSYRASCWLSDKPLLIEKLLDILGLYLKPLDKAMVLCVDEKTRILSGITLNRCRQ